jgi:hypothetical protein
LSPDSSSSSALASRIATLSLACAVLAGCGGTSTEPPVVSSDSTLDNGNDQTSDVADTGSKASCPWSIDALLGQVGARVVEARVDCGSTNGAFSEQVDELYACFVAASEQLGAEFTLNNCIDCSIPTTYVSTPTPEYFAILREADVYGDELRVARVTRCSAIELKSSVACRDAEHLYSCAEPLR